MTVQFIKTPGGEEMAVLSRAEYEAMLEAMEDAADVAAYDAAKADPEGSRQLSPEESRQVMDRARGR